ncbi:MAG: RsmE family RNA methyltransferase [Candidatus Acidiferrales bacterium]
MRRRFFVEEFQKDTAVLRGDAAEHLGHVLRAEEGQFYELSDGRRVWLAKIEHIHTNGRSGSTIEFSLVEPVKVALPPLRVELLLSVIKFDRFEWCLEKATELGVMEIVPLAAARSEKRLIAAASKRSDRWQKILLESAEQSRQLKPPALFPVLRAEQAFLNSRAGCQFLLSERPDARPVRSVQMGCLSKSISIAIGPEGGWTDAEIASARAAGYFETSLGEGILRTETAVISALSILRYALGD